MTKSMPYTRAVPFSRPAGRRRIEVFSPKIGRRLSLNGYDAYKTWLVIEANPAIITFCERPNYITVELSEMLQITPLVSESFVLN
jgi:hypothetical protein